jgi:hypothetical protein
VNGPLADSTSRGANGSAFRGRTVADGRGAVWTVCERPCAGVPGARWDRCLAFAGEYVVRRA